MEGWIIKPEGWEEVDYKYINVKKPKIINFNKEIDGIFVLAGGLNDRGLCHPWVIRRLNLAYQIHLSTNKPIFCLGGGTYHKPPILNKCKYSLDNHWKYASYLINNDKKSKAILNSLKQRNPKKVFKGKELAMLNYAEKLTISPQKITKKDFNLLKKVGLDDGEILEANQIICYFNYVNRSINGLGVTTKGDIVGYYQKT